VSPEAATLDDEIHRRFLLLPAGTAADRSTVLRRMVQEMAPLLTPDDVVRTVERIEARVGGLGPVAPLLDDPSISDILVNGTGSVWVERDGELECTAITVDVATVEHLIERIIAPLGRRADRSSPLVDARLPDGSRVHAVVPPVAVDGPCLTIRRFGVRPIGLDEFAGPVEARYLADAVAHRANIIVSGGTGAGKTTLLNALAGLLAADERIVTIEDAAELRLPGVHVVRLESQPALGVDIRSLVRNALRMRPDRIVVGECRGAEALDMLQAMNTGHDGSLSTLHANSPADALRRLEAMVLIEGSALPLRAVRDLIDHAIDLVVQVRRTDGRRRVVHEIARVVAGTPRIETVTPASESWTR
jgi:pilus assembly protein CpaF